MNSNETTTCLSKEYITFRNVLIYFIALVIIGGNLLTLIAIRKSKRLRHIPTNTFIFCLALSDGSIGLFIPFTVTVNFGESIEVWKISVCTLLGPYYSFFAISLVLLLAIAIDRFLAVVFPVLYRNRMTTKIAVVVSILIWVVYMCGTTFVTCYFGSQKIIPNFIPSAVHKLMPKPLFLIVIQGTVLIPIGGNIVLYLAIYFRLRKSNTVGAEQETEGRGTEVSRRSKIFTKMMIMVLGYLLLACFPYYFLTQLSHIDGIATSTWFVYLFDMAVVLFYSNSFMNPVIYSWMSREFKDAYKKILNMVWNMVGAQAMNASTI